MLEGAAMSDETLAPTHATLEVGRSQCIEWYHQGQSRVVEVNGIRIEVRFIGRKGRRGRIAIIAPSGAMFSGWSPSNSNRPS
jgi:hypothetical protein